MEKSRETGGMKKSTREAMARALVHQSSKCRAGARKKDPGKQDGRRPPREPGSRSKKKDKEKRSPGARERPGRAPGGERARAEREWSAPSLAAGGGLATVALLILRCFPLSEALFGDTRTKAVHHITARPDDSPPSRRLIRGERSASACGGGPGSGAQIGDPWWGPPGAPG